MRAFLYMPLFLYYSRSGTKICLYRAADGAKRLELSHEKPIYIWAQGQLTY